jgi:hypothetical protein
MARRSGAARHLLHAYCACPDPPPPARGPGESEGPAVPPPLVTRMAEVLQYTLTWRRT